MRTGSNQDGDRYELGQPAPHEPVRIAFGSVLGRPVVRMADGPKVVQVTPGTLDRIAGELIHGDD